MRKFLYWLLRLSVRPILSPGIPLGIQRKWSTAVASTSRWPRGVADAMLDMGGVPARHLRPANMHGGKVVLYLHGGGYLLGDTQSHGGLAAQIGHAAAAEVYLPDYRVAPEHPFPAALDDALAAYRWLLAQGHSASDITIAGDSAGGGLTLATTLALRDAGVALPAALVLLSPWADLGLTGDSIHSHATRDPVLRSSWLAWCARTYCGTQAIQSPACSPLFADLAGLPPMLIQVGSEEILLDDSLRLEQRATQAGTPVQLRVFDKMWHDFQAHAGVLQESDAAITEIGQFVGAQLRS